TTQLRFADSSTNGTPPKEFLAQATESLGITQYFPWQFISDGGSGGAFTELSTVTDLALTLAGTNGDMTNGFIANSAIFTAGSGYAAGDTLADNSSWGTGSLHVTVLTVDGSGHVLTYEITSQTDTGWAVGQTIGFINVAPQSGVGTGFQIKP